MDPSDHHHSHHQQQPHALSLTGAAYEGIWMTLPSLTSHSASAAASSEPPPQPLPQALTASDNGGCASSEGYLTSQDSLTSSDTISLADSEVSDSAITEAAEAASSVASSEAAAASTVPNVSPPSGMDSLTLALRELSSEKLTVVQQSHPQLPAPLKLVLAGKPAGKKNQELQQQQQQKRRSSSMKSHKTPPDTPNQMKKVVRFADAFGLDLAYVKHVFDTEKPPVVPPQAMRDLNLAEWESDSSASSSASTTVGVGSDGRHRLIGSDLQQQQQQQQRWPFISPCFAQPGISANFASRVAAQKVVLERAGAAFSQGSNEISGFVRVSNVGFEKSVLVRVTLDSWRTSYDVQAEYVPDSSTGATDQFAFTIHLPGYFGIGDRAVFCVRYEACGEVFWDNNFGDNYAFDCFAVGGAGGGRGGDVSGGPGWAGFL